MPRRTSAAIALAALLPFAALARPGTGEPSARDSFVRCAGAHRVTCVVDGDTFWYRGAKIRIADINAPEVSQPSCAREAALGERATGRLLGWLNAGLSSWRRPVASATATAGCCAPSPAMA